MQIGIGYFLPRMQHPRIFSLETDTHCVCFSAEAPGGVSLCTARLGKNRMSKSIALWMERTLRCRGWSPMIGALETSGCSENKTMDCIAARAQRQGLAPSLSCMFRFSSAERVTTVPVTSIQGSTAGEG